MTLFITPEGHLITFLSKTEGALIIGVENNDFLGLSFNLEDLHSF